MRTTSSRIAGLTLGVSLAALGPGCGDGSEGGLGQAHISADCPAEDLSCVAQGLSGPLAVGAETRLNIVLGFQGSATPPTTLRSSHPGIVAVDGDRIRGETAGHASLLILMAQDPSDDSSSEAVIDFMHVWVAAPDRLALTLYTSDGRELGEAAGGAELLPGEELVLAPRLYARGQRLLGDPASTWTTDSDAVTVLREPTAGRMRLVARKPGIANISVESGGITAGFQLEVKP